MSPACCMKNAETEFVSKVRTETRRTKVRLLWVLVGGLNFVAFLVHVIMDHGSAFPAGGRLVDGQYFFTEHGRDIPFSPSAYEFNYWHGVLFVLLHLACMIVVWRLRNVPEE